MAERTWLYNSAIARLPDLGASAFALYAVLARNVWGKDGGVNPETSSYGSLLDQTGFSSQRLSEAIKMLESNQFIEVHSSAGKPTRYRLINLDETMQLHLLDNQIVLPPDQIQPLRKSKRSPSPTSLKIKEVPLRKSTRSSLKIKEVLPIKDDLDSKRTL